MERHYLASHEWVVIEGNIARVGISQHAQEALGDIAFVDLPKVGTTVKQGEEALVIESMKAASPVNSPLDGTIAEVNSSLTGSPEKVNTDPTGDGWIFTVTEFNKEQIQSLMDESSYNSSL